MFLKFSSAIFFRCIGQKYKKSGHDIAHCE
jgi:hypothetical protein